MVLFKCNTGLLVVSFLVKTTKDDKHKVGVFYSKRAQNKQAQSQPHN